jgi:hypothetical protein
MKQVITGQSHEISPYSFSAFLALNPSNVNRLKKNSYLVA